jgi:serine/threonine protein kinase
VHQDGAAYDKLKNCSLSERLSVVIGVARGLSAVHRSGLVHGDVRPANIVYAITPSGCVPKIIDFDSSFFSADPPRPANFLGDPACYSPELARYIAGIGKGENVTTKSDVFSLGVLAAELLGARRLAEANAPLYAWKVVSQCTALHVWPAEVPQQVRSLVDQNAQHITAQTARPSRGSFRVGVACAHLWPRPMRRWNPGSSRQEMQ